MTLTINQPFVFHQCHFSFSPLLHNAPALLPEGESRLKLLPPPQGLTWWEWQWASKGMIIEVVISPTSSSSIVVRQRAASSNCCVTLFAEG